MYSNVKWNPGSKQCGNYGKEGDCYNREHSIPKSWFNDKAPMINDFHHLVPTDGYVNNRRSNYPFGQVGSATYTSGNGSKLGSSNYTGISGTVFEPIDEYKGDFARMYFYMLTRYNSQVGGWSGGVFQGEYPYLKTGYYNLYIQWAINDPVSQKEIDRNNAGYGYQGNRNPFVDCPSMFYRAFLAK
jgi:endonuclease I